MATKLKEQGTVYSQFVRHNVSLVTALIAYTTALLENIDIFSGRAQYIGPGHDNYSKQLLEH